MSPEHDQLLIYGANGYTGELIARRCLERGLRPTLAGRSATAVTAVAQQLGLPSLTVSLDDGPSLDAALRDKTVVIHCAGPFSRTSRPMAEACLRVGTHYLDITGEIPVFEALARRDAVAKAAGVMLLPGVGFDVVPSDCLALHLKQRLPTATHLELGFRALGRTSRGTALTAVESFHQAGAVRRDGKIVPTPVGWLARRIDFGQGYVDALAIPWGDVSTAYHSTGIPNITVYMALSPALITILRLSGVLTGLLRMLPIQALLRGMVRQQPPGPTEAQRARSVSLLWGEASDAEGRRVSTRLRTPDGYSLTAITTVLIAEQVLAGRWQAGFQTPSRVYGSDLILQVEGVERVDL